MIVTTPVLQSISSALLIVATSLALLSSNVLALDDDQARLADEVATKGWIAFAAKTVAGDWDVFISRPDGSARRNLTDTKDHNEGYPLFSRDGTKLIFRRLPKSEPFKGDHYGTMGELVLCNRDGSNERTLGEEGEWPWASWSPDGKQLACLTIKGIEIREIATGKVVQTLKRKGFFQQVTWSPDGKWFSGVSNAFGTSWTDARMDALTGEANAVSRVDCCTPDWFPDSARMIFSSRPGGQAGNDGQGWTQLWMANADGTERRLVFGEDGRHIYGGHVSPDGKYVLFSGNSREDGDPSRSGAPMGLMRVADAPIIGGESVALRKVHPEARNGPVLELPSGWEPSWTYSEEE
jgi:Tol biopolymer transport system component